MLYQSSTLRQNDAQHSSLVEAMRVFEYGMTEEELAAEEHAMSIVIEDRTGSTSATI